MTSYVNNKGLEITLTYQTSTSYYLRDEQEGHPWLTKIPMPVHCVDKMVKHDHISKTRTSQRLRYHHGYYDGVERSFCGFGMVEKWDTEEFDVLSVAVEGKDIANVHPATYVAPIHSKTWFHVGAFQDANTLRMAYLPGFFSNSLPNVPSPPNAIDQNLLDKVSCIVPNYSYTDEELRQSVYALKGTIMREEIYSDPLVVPYVVNEYVNTVMLTQPQGDNAFVSCRIYDHESIESEFDGSVTNVRTCQEITLLVDDYGNPLREVSIHYGRGTAPESDLEEEDRQRQKQTRVVYTETGYTNVVDEPTAYQLAVECSTQEYELVGLYSNTASLYRYEDFADDGSFSPITELPDLEYFQDGVQVVRFGGVTPAAAPSHGKRLLSSSRSFFRSDDQSRRLAFGELQSLYVLDQEYELCLTPSMLPCYMQDDKSILPSRTIFSDIGYVDLDNNGLWWMPSSKLYFSVTDGDELPAARLSFFQNRRLVDAHGNTSTLDYDSYGLLPIRTTDPYSNQISSNIDYRTLLFASVTDINDNRTDFAYDALNSLVGKAIVGKGGDNTDSLSGFNPDPSQEDLDAYFLSPTDKGASILGTATSCYFGDPSQYVDYQLPIYITTIEGERYGGTKKDVQITFSYLDGSARLIQTKQKADKSQWRVSGWQVFNNKGSPVEVYDPTFSNQHNFEFDTKTSTRELIFYDARLREVARLYPDHTWTKISYSNWSMITYNQNNLVDRNPAQDPDIGTAVQSLEPAAYSPTWYDSQQAQDSLPEQKGAAQKALAHKGKSSRDYFDAQNHTILQVSETASDLIKHRSYFNIQGHAVVEKDASGRIAEQRIYDMLGNTITFATIDTGWTWILMDAKASEVYNWSSTSRLNYAYDKLGRQTEEYYKKGENAEICTFKAEYGDDLDPTTAKSKNLRGKPYKLYDQSGVKTHQEYDVAGNCTMYDQQLAVEYKLDIDWTTDVQLESSVYTSIRTFDALGRTIFAHAPDNTQTQYYYNKSGLLSRVGGKNSSGDEGQWTPYIRSIQYDDHGRVISQMTNNGVISLYVYDDISQRLTQRIMEKGLADLQRESYIYDAKGNLVYLIDELQPTVYFRNARVTAGSEYTYDNLDRLIEATGREHIGQTRGKPFSSSLSTSTPLDGQTAAAADGSALARYTESYSFDNCGNMLQLRHQIADVHSPGWTRRFTYEEPSMIEPQKFSNGLSSSQVGNVTEQFSYDEHGNTLSMANVSKATWDPFNRLKSTVTQIAKSGSPETIYYIYDVDGLRVRKVVERASGQNHSSGSKKSSQTCYLDSADQIQKFDGHGSISLECWTSKIITNGEVCVLLERWSGALQASKSLPSLLTRYQYHDLSNSVFVEVDDGGNIISYEEYTPFGSTSYRANITEAPKRYRFAGKERDHETGFYYNEQRYYLPWLCRWLNPDPIGTLDGLNLYAYVRGNPITYQDPTGTDGQKNKKKGKSQATKPTNSTGKKALANSEIKRYNANLKRLEKVNNLSPAVRLKNAVEQANTPTWDRAHIIPQAWGHVTKSIFEGVHENVNWRNRAIRVVPALNQGGRLKDVDIAWDAYFSERIQVTVNGKKEKMSRERAMRTGKSKSIEGWRKDITEKAKEFWKPYIDWKDIEYFSIVYTTPNNKYDATKGYNPWSDQGWRDERTGRWWKNGELWNKPKQKK